MRLVVCSFSINVFVVDSADNFFPLIYRFGQAQQKEILIEIMKQKIRQWAQTTQKS